MVPSQHLQEEFEKIQKEMAELRKVKVAEYGEDRYYERNADIAILMIYSDVYRKYIRLKTQTLNCFSTDHSLDLDNLRESYLDLANYATMAVQIIDRIKKGEMGTC